MISFNVPDTGLGVGGHNARNWPFTEIPNAVEGWTPNDSPGKYPNFLRHHGCPKHLGTGTIISSFSADKEFVFPNFCHLRFFSRIYSIS